MHELRHAVAALLKIMRGGCDAIEALNEALKAGDR